MLWSVHGQRSVCCRQGEEGRPTWRSTPSALEDEGGAEGGDLEDEGGAEGDDLEDEGGAEEGNLEDEGGADGGVEGAHAIQHCMAGLQLCQQGGVWVREHFMVLLPTPMAMAQVEDALHCCLQLGTCQALVHSAGAWSVCSSGHAVGQDRRRERVSCSQLGTGLSTVGQKGEVSRGEEGGA